MRLLKVIGEPCLPALLAGFQPNLGVVAVAPKILDIVVAIVEGRYSASTHSSRGWQCAGLLRPNRVEFGLDEDWLAFGEDQPATQLSDTLGRYSLGHAVDAELVHRAARRQNQGDFLTDG